MATVPRDLTDLYLAPLVLEVDARIEALAKLSAEDLILAVEGVSDNPIIYRSMREEALITTIESVVDSHGWTFVWDRRGLRLTHGERSLVLGVPATFLQYLAAPHK